MSDREASAVGITELQEAWSSFLGAASRERERAYGWPDEEFPHFSEERHWRRLSIGARSGWEGQRYEHGNWTAGFWFGVMWLLAKGANDARAAALARDRLVHLTPRATDTSTHDLGFLFFPSVALGFSLGFIEDTGPGMKAAAVLARRFNSRGGYIQAFGPIGDDRFAGTSTIDTMMNLPLLWWAAARGADPFAFAVARKHARTSARLFLRNDGSTYHLCQFDPLTGALLHRGTYQGASDSSCWSRGQAWAVSGFAWAFAASDEPEFLASAERAAAYFWDRLPANGVPPWDFSDPDPQSPLDSSASAIAALGVLILSRIHPDPSARERYVALGVSVLRSLHQQCINRSESAEGILLHSCYSRPHGLGLDGATAWGDFFCGLALALATRQLSLPAILGFMPRQDPASPDEATPSKA